MYGCILQSIVVYACVVCKCFAISVSTLVYMLSYTVSSAVHSAAVLACTQSSADTAAAILHTHTCWCKLHSTSSKQHYTGMAAATYVVLDRAGHQRPQGLLTVS
jgi:hypothetical protein